MSDILSRLEAQGQDFSNIAQRGQEMVQGFDNDRLMAQGQTLAYNMGKAQLSTLIGAETVAGLQHGVPVTYKTGKAIAQRLQGMPTTKEEAVARASKAVAQRVKSTAQPLVDRVAQETTSGAPGDFLKYDVAQGVPVNRATGQVIGNDYFDSELQTLSGERADPALKAARLERLDNPPDPAPDQFRTVPDRLDLSGDWKSSKAPTEAEFRAETEARRVAARASDGSRLAPPESDPIPAVAESEPSIGRNFVEGQTNQPSSYVRPGTSLRVEGKAPQSVPEVKAPSGNRFADTGEPAPPPPPRDAPGGPEAPRGANIAQEASDRQMAGEIGQDALAEDAGAYFTGLRPVEQSFAEPPPSLPTPAVPVAQQQAQAQTSALSQQDDEETNLQERLQNLRVQDGDGSGGSQPSQQPEFKADEDEPDKPSGVLDDITKAELDTAPEQEIADAIPGLGEIIGGAIGLGSLIAGAVEGGETPKAPQQPPGMPAMQTAYDSAPVIDSSDYHSL